MNTTKTSNGVMWSCLAFSIFMVIHFYAVLLGQYSSTLYSLVVELSLIPISILFFVFVKKFANEGRGFNEFMSFKIPGLTNTVLSILAVLLMIPFSTLLVLLNDFIVRLFVENPLPIPDSTVYMLEYGFWPAILMFAVLPAVCEEIFFRGFVLGATSGKSKVTILIVNGFLFALAHMSMYRVIDTFIFGMVFTYVALKTKSIFPSIVMHFVNNGARVFLLFFLYNSGVMDYAGSGEVTEPVPLTPQTVAIYIIMALLVILIFVAAMFILSRMKSREEHKRWLHGVPAEPESPRIKDKMPIATQWLFVIPGLFVFILFSVAEIVDSPIVIRIVQFLWGV